jgi:ADP-ribose pyrophosphatase YjhB (NUDIX family)
MPVARKTVKADRWLPEKFYQEHLLHLPVATVDMVVTDSSSRCLLVRRNGNNHNWKGIWATPGGRIWRNEKAADSASRVLLRETGLDLTPDRFFFSGFHEIVTAKEHGVTLVYKAQTDQASVRPDKTSSSVAWFEVSRLPRTLNFEYLKILRIGGVEAAVGGA